MFAWVSKKTFAEIVVMYIAAILLVYAFTESITISVVSGVGIAEVMLGLFMAKKFASESRRTGPMKDWNEKYLRSAFQLSSFGSAVIAALILIIGYLPVMIGYIVSFTFNVAWQYKHLNK